MYGSDFLHSAEDILMGGCFFNSAASEFRILHSSEFRGISRKNPFFVFGIRTAFAKSITHFGVICTRFVISLNIHLFCGPHFKRGRAFLLQSIQHTSRRTTENKWRSMKDFCNSVTLHGNTDSKYSGLEFSAWSLWIGIVLQHLLSLHVNCKVHGLVNYTDTGINLPSYESILYSFADRAWGQMSQDMRKTYEWPKKSLMVKDQSSLHCRLCI